MTMGPQMQPIGSKASIKHWGSTLAQTRVFRKLTCLRTSPCKTYRCSLCWECSEYHPLFTNANRCYFSDVFLGYRSGQPSESCHSILSHLSVKPVLELIPAWISQDSRDSWAQIFLTLCSRMACCDLKLVILVLFKYIQRGKGYTQTLPTNLLLTIQQQPTQDSSSLGSLFQSVDLTVTMLLLATKLLSVCKAVLMVIASQIKVRKNVRKARI